MPATDPTLDPHSHLACARTIRSSVAKEMRRQAAASRHVISGDVVVQEGEREAATSSFPRRASKGTTSFTYSLRRADALEFPNRCARILLGDKKERAGKRKQGKLKPFYKHVIIIHNINSAPGQGCLGVPQSITCPRNCSAVGIWPWTIYLNTC
jgi:hypothetical protein